MWLDDVPFPIVAQTSDFVPVLPDLKGRVNLGKCSCVSIFDKSYELDFLLLLVKCGADV